MEQSRLRKVAEGNDRGLI